MHTCACAVVCVRVRCVHEEGEGEGGAAVPLGVGDGVWEGGEDADTTGRGLTRLLHTGPGTVPSPRALARAAPLHRQSHCGR